MTKVKSVSLIFVDNDQGMCAVYFRTDPLDAISSPDELMESDQPCVRTAASILMALLDSGGTVTTVSEDEAPDTHIEAVKPDKVEREEVLFSGMRKLKGS